jgi:hypothetical protein
MNNNQFNRVVSERLGKIDSTLCSKAKEYASDTDRLHNFKVAAMLETKEQTPEQALWGMIKKHLVSVIDIIDKTALGESPSNAMRDEKIGDSINYLILLEALLIERTENILTFEDVK